MRAGVARGRLRAVSPRSGAWAARSVLALGGLLAVAATTSGASAADLGVGVAPAAAGASSRADVQVLTVVRAAVTGSGKYAGAPAPAPAAPPAPAAVPEVGPMGIPGTPYAAYRSAETRTAAEQPACGISWTLLAAISYVESSHVHMGRVDATGRALEPVFGPVLDGSGAGDGVVPDTDHGVLDGDPVHDRAVGPTQFLPSTWAIYGADGNGDGIKDPQNVFDSALGTAHYLCAEGMNLRDAGQVSTAVYRYNHSYEYVAKVTSWATAYATGRTPSSGSSSSGSSSSSSSSGYSSGSGSSGYSGSSSSGSSSSSGYSSGSSYSSGS